MQGRYLVIEGGNGLGKSTQVEIAANHLRSLGFPVISTLEPEGDELGQAIRSIVKGYDNEVTQAIFHGKDYTMNAVEHVMWFNAARARLLAQIEAWLAEGNWVIADRNWISTVTHQGYGDRLNVGDIKLVCRFATQQLAPDLTLILDAPFEVALARMEDRGGPDLIEAKGPVFLRRVHEAYAIIARDEGIPIIDADRPVNVIADDIWRHIQPLTEGAC